MSFYKNVCIFSEYTGREILNKEIEIGEVFKFRKNEFSKFVKLKCHDAEEMPEECHMCYFGKQVGHRVTDCRGVLCCESERKDKKIYLL